MFRQIILLSSKNFKNKQKLNSKKLIKSRSTPNILPEENISFRKSAYYQKLYSIKNPNDNSFSNFNKKISPKKISLKKVFAKPDFPKPKFQFRKITIAKSPFSLNERDKETKEEAKERIKLSKPSKLFHTFLNIQWLRRKFPENVINKSIYTLLPNNGKPVVPDDESEEDKRHRLMIEFLEEMKGPVGKEKYIDINPKYFFNKQTWDTVQKLKQIFLAFDADGNRRFELDEMQEMFESNKISASINDLVDLFFKGKKFKQSEIMKLYLNFHQFINFGLTKDQEFREFMRNIKEKLEKGKDKTNESKSESSNEESESNETKGKNEEEKGQYLPMDFKSLLDYFVDRGKQRDSKEVINKAIKDMDEIIDMGKKKLKSKKADSSNNNENENQGNNKVLINRKSYFTQKTINPNQIKGIIQGIKNINKNSKKNLKEVLDSIDYDFSEEDNMKIDYDKQLSEIDFNKLINEFSTLFSLDQIPKKKTKNQEINQRLELIKKSKKNFENIKEKENQNKNQKNNLKKTETQDIFDSMTILNKDNILNNLMKSKSQKSFKKQKPSIMNDFRTIDKYIKIPASSSYFDRNVFKNNEKNNYYNKIRINYNPKNNIRQSGYLQDIKNSKNSYKILDYKDKAKGIFPSIRNYSTKNKSNSMTNIFLSSKGSIFNQHRRKINLNNEKSNLFQDNTIIRIPKSNSKMDYVPLGLLFKSKSDLPF